MTATEKSDMFAKEYLGISDIAKLYGLCYNRASMLLREIKFNLEITQGKKLRINLRGKIHVKDYEEWRDYKGEVSTA